MKVRICPLCDQPMKKAHRCDYCHSFIWKPQYLDIHYNTDVTGGTDCSYGAAPHPDDTQEQAYSFDDDAAYAPRRENKTRTEKPKMTVERHTAERERTKMPDRKKKFILLAVAFVIVVVPNIVEGIIGWLSFNERNSYTSAEEYIVDDTSNYIEYSKEDVIAGGTECNSLEHMDVTLEEFLSTAELPMSKLGIDISDYADNTSNYGYDYDGDGDVSTYFRLGRMYSVTDANGDYNGYYDIDCDTSSQRIHEVTFNVAGSDLAEAVYVLTMQALEGDGEQFREAFRNCRQEADEDGYVFFEDNGYELYISDDDYTSSDSYYVSITKAN